MPVYIYECEECKATQEFKFPVGKAPEFVTSIHRTPWDDVGVCVSHYMRRKFLPTPIHGAENKYASS